MVYSFFKKAQSIVRGDIIEAFKNFFESDMLLKVLNCTFIALVPKYANLFSCNDFRPISYYNTIFKCITKIMANRIKHVLLHVINVSQETLWKEGRLWTTSFFTKSCFLITTILLIKAQITLSRLIFITFMIVLIISSYSPLQPFLVLLLL